MSAFVGRLQLDFGDWGSSGRIAITMADITWRGIVLKAGFMSDGASTPRIVWWFLPPWGDTATVAALFHDYTTDLLAKGMPLPGYDTRKKCDKLFYDCLVDLGLPAWRARAAWLGVRSYSVLVERHPL